MGVRGLTNLIHKKAAAAKIYVSDTDVVGSKYAIDSSILLYKFSHASKTYEHSHTTGFMNKVVSFLNGGILPVFVFDGEPPDEKMHTLNKRKEDKRKLYSKVEALEAQLPNLVEKDEIEACRKNIEHYRNQIVKVTEVQKVSVLELLAILGIPVIESPGEAEQTCAYLQRTGMCDYCVTDDSDAFPFGAKRVIRLSKLAPKTDSVEVICLDKILNILELSYVSFVDMCILSGCDFCGTIPRVGPISAFKYIAKYGTIEELFKAGVVKEPERFEYSKARKIFMAQHTPIDVPLKLSPMKTQSLSTFLKAKNFQQREILKWTSKLENARQTFEKLEIAQNKI